jgi:hypothetical protein
MQVAAHQRATVLKSGPGRDIFLRAALIQSSHFLLGQSCCLEMKSKPANAMLGIRHRSEGGSDATSPGPFWAAEAWRLRAKVSSCAPLTAKHKLLKRFAVKSERAQFVRVNPGATNRAGTDP